MAFNINNSVIKKQRLRQMAMVFSLAELFFLYNYYSTGEFINESLRQKYVFGWFPWLVCSVVGLTVFANSLICRGIIHSSYSTKEKIGSLFILLASSLLILQRGILFIVGSMSAWVHVITSYTVLIGLTIGYVITKE